MGIKIYKPYTPGTRNKTVLDFSTLSKKAPEKSLTVANHRARGRNNKGRITIRHKGGGHKRLYRLIDFKRSKYNIEGTVKAIEYDPNRNANIALVSYQDGEKRYILHPENLKIGDSISLDNYYYAKSFGKKYGRYYEKQQKYGVKSQNIAELIRKGSSFITTFPNPVMDKLNIHCDVSNLIEANYMLLDQAGRKVFENDISDIRTPTVLSTASYTPGVYYLYLIVDGELFTKKIVKS